VIYILHLLAAKPIVVGYD